MILLRRPEGAVHAKKRRGRGQGSGLGCTAGRGNNGQNARSGGGVRPGFEGGQMPLYRRVARRGFSNYPFKCERVILNIVTIDEKYSSGETISRETLVAKKLVRSNLKNDQIKILGVGETTKKFKIVNLVLSASARVKFEKAGGSISEAVVRQEGDNGE